MSIELMLNGVNLSIVAFGSFIPGLKDSASIIALIVMAVAAAEATVGLAIVHRDLPQPAHAARRRIRRDAAIAGA